jgi:hypothetical protein
MLLCISLSRLSNHVIDNLINEARNEEISEGSFAGACMPWQSVARS